MCCLVSSLTQHLLQHVLQVPLQRRAILSSTLPEAHHAQILARPAQLELDSDPALWNLHVFVRFYYSRYVFLCVG